MSKTIVGLDIGSRTLRAVEVADVGKAHPILVRHHEVAVPDGAVSRGEVIEPNTVATALKNLWAQGRFGSRKVVLGMGNQRVLARDLSVPKAPIEHIKESLPFQVQDLLPLPVSDALLDFYPVSEAQSANGPVINGLLIAAVKDAVAGNVAAVQAAGLVPVAVDLIPFALHRALVAGRLDHGTVALIDIGENTTSVVVTTDGVAQFVRLISTGGGELTTALCERMGIDSTRAEQVKRTLGLTATVETPEEQQARAIIIELSNELLSSLRNTVRYFINTRPESPVGGIVLTGGASRLPGFASALEEFTRLPVAVGDPYPAVRLSRKLHADELRRRGGSLSVALGLALGGQAA